MFRVPHHPSDEDLVLFADEELLPRRLARVQGHLADCATCATRLRGMRAALVEAHSTLRHEHIDAGSAAATARAAFRAKLAQADAESRSTPFQSLSRWRALAYTGGLAVIVLVVALQTFSRWPAAPSSDDAVWLLPKADLTPGALRQVTAAGICAGDGVRVHAVPASLQERIFRTYGADYRRATEYELDYLITPELGGIQDAANLWPQRYRGTKWSAYVKDELERLFHERICEGQMDLATAQREMATDWIAAYKRHFRTDAPLRNYETHPLTALDADLIRSELAEMGMSVDRHRTDGRTMLTMLHVARATSTY
jgi:hypothetical protein